MSPHTTATLRGSRAHRSRLLLVAAPRLRLSHLAALMAGIVLCSFLQLQSQPKVALETAASPRPALFDLTGPLRFGSGSDALGGLLVYDGSGQVVGRYVDDTTPNQAAVINEEWNSGVTMIIAGIAPGTPNLRYAHALNAQEWYPYNSGYQPADWGPMPPSQAYILQWRYSLTGRAPTQRERMKLLREARRHHPVLIMGY